MDGPVHSVFGRYQPLRRVLSYFESDWRQILLLLGVIAVSTLLGLASVWPAAILVDSVLASAVDGPMPARAPLGLAAVPLVWQITLLAAATLVLRLGQELTRMARNLMTMRIRNSGLHRVRCELFRKLQELSILYHRSQSQGDTIYRLTQDTQGCQQVISVCLDVIVAASMLASMLSLMAWRSVELTLTAMLVVPALLFVNVRYASVLRKQSRIAHGVESEFTSTVQRAISCIGLTQAFCRERDETARFRHVAGRTLDEWFILQRQMEWYRLWVGVIFGCGTALIFGYGGYLAYRDQFLGTQSDGMTVGSLMVFLTYLTMLYEPLCTLSGAGANVASGMTGMERVFELLDQPASVREQHDPTPLPQQPRTLRLNAVSFQYRTQRPVLRQVSVCIEPGEMVAFVGSSGVGKSTILNLLPRFYDPCEGSLQLDDVDVRTISLRDLRSHIAVVLQEGLLLPTSIAENIAYGRPSATDEEIRRAAEMAGAAEFIDKLPEGFQTVISESGQNLSGGQRQRIAIARALLSDAPILVMDEPTSALDADSERRLVETLHSLKGERTIILVSHRLSTVAGCDRIFVMQAGQIIECGDHEQLLRRGGLYADMAAQQSMPLVERQAVGAA